MAEVKIETREDVVKKVRKVIEVLSEEGVEIIAAYLYGSHAEGIAHPDSDIDLAIVSPSLSGIRVDDWVRLNVPASYIDTRMEVMGFRPDQFRDEHPLAWEVKTKGIRLL